MTNKVNNSKALTAGVWYTISIFLTKGMAFLSAPIFTRLLTASEFGNFSVFASWMSVLYIVTSCDIPTSIIRSKLDFSDRIDEYASSTLVLTSVITIFVYTIFVIFRRFIFGNLLHVDENLVHFMFLNLLFVTAWYTYSSKCRALYEYKKFSVITFFLSFFSLGLSIFLVLTMKDKLLGRIIGQYGPEILLGLVFYIIVIGKNHKIDLNYWKYALKLSVPLVPHLLSLSLLSSSDKIIIGYLINSKAVALYSIAVMCANILSILLDAMNKAWAPWFLDTLHEGNILLIKKASATYYSFFLLLTSGVIMLGPEIILILGGKSYQSALQFLPPLLIGCIFQFAYSLYVQCEIYERKTIAVSIGTLLAAVINIVLNFILIPKFGVLAAALSTLFGYFCLFLFHYFFVKHLGYEKIFHQKIIFGGLFYGIVLLLVAPFIYKIFWVRYILLFVITIFSLFLFNRVLKYKKKVS